MPAIGSAGRAERHNAVPFRRLRSVGRSAVPRTTPGIDPEKDVEISVSDGELHIDAERRQEKKDEGKDYYVGNCAMAPSAEIYDEKTGERRYWNLTGRHHRYPL
jgi:hypothetical protein